MLSCNLVYFQLNGKYSDDNKTHLHMFKTESHNCGLHSMFVGVDTFVLIGSKQEMTPYRLYAIYF